MKKTTSILLVLCLLLTVASLSSCGKEGDITGYGDTVSIVGRAVPTFTVAETGDFTVLQFTDTHFISGSTKKDEKTLAAMRAQIDAKKPDLVVISGDMVEGKNASLSYNKQAVLETVGAMFEEMQQYWAYVPGNNDGEVSGSTADVTAFLAQYKYCIESNAENLTGVTQYAVDLYDANQNLVHSLLFMDSLARDADNNYDYMKADQVQWAKDTISAKKAENPNVTVSVFFHMNTPNFANAGKSGTAYSVDCAPIPADFYEGIDGNAPLDAVFQEAGCVGLVSIGHIHPDTNYCSFYKNTYYQVVRSSGFSVADAPGCALITIHTAASSVQDMYDFEDIAF